QADLQRGIDLYTVVHKEAPFTPRAFIKKSIDEVIKAFKAALEKGGNDFAKKNPHVYYQMGKAYIQIENYEKAEKAYYTFLDLSTTLKKEEATLVDADVE